MLIVGEFVLEEKITDCGTNMTVDEQTEANMANCAEQNSTSVCMLG